MFHERWLASHDVALDDASAAMTPTSKSSVADVGTPS